MPTEEVVILGCTRAGIMLCIGGMVIDSGKSLRLKREEDFTFWPTYTDFKIGKCFDITYETSENLNNPHHVEDVLVHKSRFTRELSSEDIIALLKRHAAIAHSDDPRSAFNYRDEQPIINDQGTCYVSEKDVGRLLNSIGFWLSTQELHYRDGRYFGDNLRFKYVGHADPIDVIPNGTIVRLSTAGLWQGKQFPERRSYLQLSGWF